MNIAELRTEFYARGFDYVDDTGSTTRADLWLNRGYHLLLEREPWPFLRTTASGTAPLTISDLRSILYVTDSTHDRNLQGVDERTVRDWDADLAAVGTAECWYLTGGNVLNVSPADTSSTFTVVYLEVPDDLSDSNTAPVVPSRYHYLIIEAACHYAYRDNDEPEAAQFCKAVFDEEVSAMAETLLSQNYQGSDYVLIDTPYDA